jgi:hypothetical protein
MPVKRRLSKMHSDRITPSVVASYARALELRKLADRGAAGQMEAHELEATVERALGGGIRRLWLPSVFDVFEFQEPGDPDWERCASLRRQLDAALAEAAKQRRRVPEPEPDRKARYNPKVAENRPGLPENRILLPENH